jgi:hypothetical protein
MDWVTLLTGNTLMDDFFKKNLTTETDESAHCEVMCIARQRAAQDCAIGAFIGFNGQTRIKTNSDLVPWSAWYSVGV